MKLFFHVRLLALKCLDWMLVAADMSQVLRVAYAGDWQHHVWAFPRSFMTRVVIFIKVSLRNNLDNLI